MFPVITVPYVSRILGVENIGLVGFVTSYISYFVIFAALGISVYGVREIAKLQNDNEKSSKLFCELFSINVISTLIVSVIFIVSVFSVPLLAKDKLLFMIAGVSLFLSPLSIDWYFQGKEDFKMITIRSAIFRVFSVVLLFWVVKTKDDIIPYILISSFSIIGSNIWNLIYAKKQGLIFSFQKINLKQHLNSMFVIFGSSVAVSIFVMLDVVMLGFLSTYEETGFFTSANKIVMIILSILYAINTVALPKLSFNKENNSDNSVLLQKIFDFTSLFIVPTTIGLFLCSTRFVPLFFGDGFAGAIKPMQILSLKIIVVLINSFFSGNILFVAGFEKKLLFVFFAIAFLSFILNYIFIPKFGAIGAAATSVAAESFQIGINLYLVLKLTQTKIRWNNMLKAILFSLPIILLYFVLNPLLNNSLLFLTIFVFGSCILYLLQQIYIGKNQLIINFVKF